MVRLRSDLFLCLLDVFKELIGGTLNSGGESARAASFSPTNAMKRSKASRTIRKTLFVVWLRARLQQSWYRLCWLCLSPIWRRGLSAVAQRGGGGGLKFHSPLPILGAYFRFELLSTTTFHCENSMKQLTYFGGPMPCLRGSILSLMGPFRHSRILLHDILLAI